MKSMGKPFKIILALGVILGLNACDFLKKEGQLADVQKEVDKKSNLEYIKKDGNLLVTLNNKPVLNYRFGFMEAPKGKDSLFRRSGFIHPLWSPNGDTLSRVQPPDHIHHYGVWGPWTKTKIEGRSVDFWNLGEGQGTVQFKELKNIESNPNSLSFVARQEHLDFGATPENRVAIIEDLQLKVWDLENDARYMIDYNSKFSSPLKNGLLFEAYRYGGGIGFRAAESWTNKNSTVLTSEGKDRLTADGTNARWCIVSVESAEKSKSGILFLSHPENREHPEPMRVWPIDANGNRGDMFFEFSPIRDKDWVIESNKEYQLQYRMVVFQGELTKEEAEEYWIKFSKSK
ncbi:PmoA family protein [Cellulophaga sp. F20128]|uniref:DUF6807 domain-containing protein n=1 Tax=Cellulophaga sp. F20128 TaxID=2926413 RepID=UPI001FF42487|nr:PmoA family protein [Cellulophaga sp. F20128]